MKYVYGKRMKTFKDRFTTLVASLAILANSAGMAAPFIFVQKAAAATALTNVDAYYASGNGYTGIGVDFTTDEVTTATDVELRVHRDSGAPVSIHGTSVLLNSINTSVTDVYTTSGTVIVTGSRTSSSDSWPTMTGTWTGSSRPVSVEVLITLSGGAVLSLTDTTIVNNGGNTQATVFAGVPATTTCNASTFDSGFVSGSVNGQGGWSATGPYDQEIVDNSYSIDSFGCKTLRISNAVTSGGFGNQTFSSPAVNGLAGEDAANDHFEAQFDIASTQASHQNGLALSISPDRGDGARMSYLSFTDTPGGIDVVFYDVQGENAGYQVANFVDTTVATDLSRSEPHTIKFVMDFVDGPSNDVVEIYIDGALVHTGTSWENYYRFDTESQGNPHDPSLENKSRSVDSLLFRASDTAVSANSGNGFLFDNVNISTSLNTPADTTAPAVPTGLHRVAKDDGEVMACAVITQRQILFPTWDANTEADFSHYEYTSYNANGNVGINEQVVLTNQFVHNWTPPVDGTNGFKVRAVDTSGNKSDWTEVCPVTYDSTAPNKVLGMTIKHNGNPLGCSAYINGRTITVDWDDSTDENFSHYLYQNIDGGTIKKPTISQFTGDIRDQDGYYQYRVAAVDKAGNVGEFSDWCGVTLDRETPETEILSASIDSNAISFTGNVSDDNLNYYYCWLTTNQVVTVDGHTYTPGQEVKLNGNTTSTRNTACNTTWAGVVTNFTGTIGGFNITGLPAGDYTINLVARDLAGNHNASNPAQYVVTIDDEPSLLADYFTVHPDHLGVGFSIADFDDATSIEVSIFDADDNLITKNTGTSALILALLNSHTGQISSPFYIPFGDTTDGYWVFGNADWADVMPAYAVITINYGTGDSVSDQVNFVSVNPDTNIEYQDLLGSSLGLCIGQDVNCGNSTSDRNPITDVLSRERGGTVLGTNTDGLANTGTQNGGIVALVAASLMAIALVVLRRKQEN